MADCPISPLECVKEVGQYIATECLWPPVQRHVYYWWRFDDNIEALEEKIHNLKLKMLDIEQKIEQARGRGESPTPEIQNWPKESTQKLDEATRISQGCGDLKAWHIFSRYTVGKNAKEMAEVLEKLRKDGDLIRIAYPAPLPSMVSISLEPTMEFESRRRIEENILEYLMNDDHVSMIAICGPGGVGKTTMVKRIVNRVRKDNIFDEVVMVVVSQQIDMYKIQKEVAELLSLKFSEDSLAARATKLHCRLLDSNRKLIIFDDVWEKFKLDEIGIPLGNCSMRCKIILTSRVKDACEKMNAQKVIPLEGLNEEEAWSLFKEKAGSYVEGPDLRPIAKAVAAECKGLPVALVTVGESLKDQSIQVWRDSLSQLERSLPSDIPGVIENVYKPLKLSYDFLKNESLESLFLLCCLFPEDYDIPIEHLTLYGIGLGIFKKIRNIEEGRRRTYNFVKQLKSRFLLMNGSEDWMEEHYVKMHDVVRDVTIFIGSEEKHGFLKSLEVPSMDPSSKDSSHDCNWMSTDISIENTKLPFGLDFPNLRLLMILGSSKSVVDANVIFFKGMEELNVLSLSRINLEALPPTLGLLKKLKTLHLYECRVKDISLVGELENLKILCIQYCDNIEELPETMKRLNGLRFLELSYKWNHKTVVVVSAISSLIGLEELKIDCFDFKWEANGNQSEEKKASLSVLEFPPSLTSLEMLVSEVNFVAQEIPPLPQKLVKYRICSGEFWRSPGDMKHERHIALNLRGYDRVGNWIHRLVKSTQTLELKGDGSNNFNLAEISSLRTLTITECSTVKKLVDAIDCKFFPVLEHLELIMLVNLKSIIDGTIPEGSNSFQKLKSLIVRRMSQLGYLWKSLNQNVSLGNLVSISIQFCNNLRYLFSVAIVRSLVQLQRLEIQFCGALEQVFWNEIENNTDHASIIEFPKLQEMSFCVLPNLAAFSQGVEIVDLPQITRLEIIRCPKLRMKIGKWNIKLQELKIWNNEAMEEISWIDEIRDEGERHIIFPELRSLELDNLPRLTTFYKGVESIKFPKLEKMKVINLARMNSLLALDSEATHDQHCLHFFCNQKVEIPGLEILLLFNLVGNINKIWCPCVPVNFFHNLKTLAVHDLVGITNLMSSSIAKNLVNLHRLTIKRCMEMVIVIEDETAVFVTSLFPKLRQLVITNLPKLKSFCHWENSFELPSLQKVDIYGCAMMETFSLGSVSAPDLSYFFLNGEHIERKDLNEVIRDHFMNKTHEDEDEDEALRMIRSLNFIQDGEDEKQVAISQTEKDSPSNDFLETAEGLERFLNDGNLVSVADPAPRASMMITNQPWSLNREDALRKISRSL